MQTDYQKLYISGTEYLCYNQEIYDKTAPYFVFLSGFMSDMTGSKATYISEYARNNKINFIRFDYFGHGKSSRKFGDCTIGLWKENCLSIIDNLTPENAKIILIGSSMGGWLMLLTALERKHKVHGMIGLASAPDFTEDLIWNTLSPSQQKTLSEERSITLPADFCDHEYTISYNLITEARDHLLMNQKSIDIDVPAILIHGTSDQDVPFQYSINIAEKLSSKNVKTILLKNATHRLTEESSKLTIFHALKDITREIS